MTVTTASGPGPGRQPGFGLPPRPVSPGEPGPPGGPGQPGEPGQPRWPAPPGWPDRPGAPEPVTAPARVWLNPAGWPADLYQRLLEQRIVMASGLLDDDAATRLSAQLLTLDAEGDDPIRLELQGLSADLSAALTVMGVLDVVGVPVHARAGGRISGPALGVLAVCDDRRGYPNAVFELAEPRLDFDGRASELAAREEQLRVQLDSLYLRLADVTGREVDQLRADARQNKLLTVDQAVAYSLIQGQAQPR
jgi:ATP-dependent Clp protease, protease subunit